MQLKQPEKVPWQSKVHVLEPQSTPHEQVVCKAAVLALAIAVNLVLCPDINCDTAKRAKNKVTTRYRFHII